MKKRIGSRHRFFFLKDGLTGYFQFLMQCNGGGTHNGPMFWSTVFCEIGVDLPQKRYFLFAVSDNLGPMSLGE